jgi:ERCC4-type nuclease
MASLTAREDSGVRGAIPCSNPALLADMAIRLARKHIEDSDKEFVPQPVQDPDVDPMVQMFCAVPGVGVKTAKNLSDEYPSIAKFIAQMDHDKLQEVDGVGEKTATDIIDTFT